ncbi:flagellar hook protein FlgE [Pollutimonas harenae]|uniref:Flagellar hook protein FlgE n=1 Tax=Pollutimonas harenae TaxID=657015 RepID=A0A853GV66_9BURK|nr:flagellar hook protein FlgE [Pollutimonas harenae]NYT87068.1 flagellar hook protein FlgE [Pollutimonas harenae]TEA71287.1 flagellar hook protein FlgE [Pollutimonas harenae]
MGFGQGLSGLNAAAQNLDVIGNNIANSGTVGFKSGTASFADVYASSRVGLGTQVASINQRFTIGSVSSTGNQFDMAIDGASGLFRVTDPSGSVLYTRNGQFSPDKDGYLVNAQGYQLTGYEEGGTNLVPVRVPSGNIAPSATSTVTSKVNVDANAPLAVGTFDPAVPSTYTHSLPINVYDSLGNSHQMMQYFAKRPSEAATPDISEWDVYYRIGGQAVTDPVSGVERMRFDQGGRLVEPTAPVTVQMATVPGASPANALNFTVDYAGSTQFGGDFTFNFNQNGYPTGEYASMAIAADGSIVASYTNGETQSMGSLVLVDFANLQGLQPVGGNAWIETSTSGQPILGRPGSNGMARIKGQAVEESNVDMSQELVNMIIAQRTYQANAQTIKTQDQIMQTLISMR